MCCPGKIIEMPDEREVCRAVHQTSVMTPVNHSNSQELGLVIIG